MQITHNEITAGLWCLVFIGGGTVGHLIAWRADQRRLDKVWRDGYEQGCDDELASCEALDRVRDDLTEHGVSAVAYLGVAEEQLAKHVQSHQDGELYDCQGARQGRYPDGREYPTDPGPTVNAELAALADGPESDSPALASEGAPVDPHWYANGLHALADWQAEWHEDAARFDAWLPGYLDWYRRSLEPSWSQASRMLEAL